MKPNDPPPPDAASETPPSGRSLTNAEVLALARARVRVPDVHEVQATHEAREAYRSARRMSDAAEDEPPPALDDAIKAAARRAVNTKPHLYEQSWLTRNRTPLAAAAVIVLSASVVSVMQIERPDSVSVNAPTARTNDVSAEKSVAVAISPTSAPMSAPAPASPTTSSAPSAATPVVVTPAPVVAPAAEPAAAPAADAAVVADKRTSTPAGAAAQLQKAMPAEVAAESTRDRKDVSRRVSESAAASVERPASAVAAAPAPAAPPAAAAASNFAPASPPSPARVQAAAIELPDAWIMRLLAMQKAGDTKLVDELRRFKSAYPSMALPKSLADVDTSAPAKSDAKTPASPNK